MSRPAFASEHYASRATRVLRIADVLVDPPKALRWRLDWGVIE
jgi:hypothetical protein